MTHRAHHKDGDGVEDESGDDLIETEPSEVVPDDHRDGTDDHTGQGAVTRHALVPQAQENDRTEGTTETGPSVAHQAQNAASRVHSNHDGKQRNAQDHQATHPNEFLRGGLRTEVCAIEVFR